MISMYEKNNEYKYKRALNQTFLITFLKVTQALCEHVYQEGSFAGAKHRDGSSK